MKSEKLFTLHYSLILELHAKPYRKHSILEVVVIADKRGFEEVIIRVKDIG